MSWTRCLNTICLATTILFIAVFAMATRTLADIWWCLQADRVTLNDDRILTGQLFQLRFYQMRKLFSYSICPTRPIYDILYRSFASDGRVGVDAGAHLAGRARAFAQTCDCCAIQTREPPWRR